MKYKITTEVFIETEKESEAENMADMIYTKISFLNDNEFDSIKNKRTETTLEKESWLTIAKR